MNWLVSAIVSWIVSAVLLIVVDRLDVGLKVRGFTTALVAALVIGVLNVTLGWLLHHMAKPLNVLSFYVFSLAIAWVINAIVLYVAAQLVPRFRIASFKAALVAALVLAVLNWLVGQRFPMA